MQKMEIKRSKNRNNIFFKKNEKNVLTNTGDICITYGFGIRH